jgi:lipopolysaccharide export system protein LptA
VFLTPLSAFPETREKLMGKGDNPTIVVKADSLEIDNKQKVATFAGNVDAKRDDFTIYCQKIQLFYEEQQSGASSEKTKVRIKKIVASGNVKILRAGGGTATADQAVYYQDREMAVLTGNPVVKQGNDSVEGSRITLYMKENRSVVEGSENRKVKAVLAPR